MRGSWRGWVGIGPWLLSIYRHPGRGNHVNKPPQIRPTGWDPHYEKMVLQLISAYFITQLIRADCLIAWSIVSKLIEEERWESGVEADDWAIWGWFWDLNWSSDLLSQLCPNSNVRMKGKREPWQLSEAEALAPPSFSKTNFYFSFLFHSQLLAKKKKYLLNILTVCWSGCRQDVGDLQV